LLVTKSFIIRRGDVNEATGQRLLGGSAGLVPGAGQPGALDRLRPRP